MNNDRNISGSFNNTIGLGTTYAQHEAGVNSWDTYTSAQTKISVRNIEKNGLPVKTDSKNSPVYDLAFKLGQMFK